MPIEPTDAELQEEVHRSFMLDVHTCLPAITRSYDAAKQVGNFLPVVKGSVKDAGGNNTFEQRPEIQNVPVRWERAGGYYEHKPLAAGDHGWLLFSEDSYAHWRATGELSEPGDLTRHAISYPFFLPGAWPDDQPLPDAPASGEAVMIVPAGGHIRVSEAGALGDQVMTANAFMAALAAGSTAAGGAAVAVGAGGAAAAFTAFVGAFSAAAISSSKLKAQAP